MTQRVGLLMERAGLMMWRAGLWISRGLGSKTTMPWIMAAVSLLTQEVGQVSCATADAH